MENKSLSDVAAELVMVELEKEAIKSYIQALDDLQAKSDELANQIESLLE